MATFAGRRTGSGGGEASGAGSALKLTRRVRARNSPLGITWRSVVVVAAGAAAAVAVASLTRPP